MESIAKIRHRYHVKGQKISKIARDLNIARNTVKKILRSNEPEINYTRENNPAPQLGPYVDELKTLLEANEKAPGKEKYTAQRLFEVLTQRGYQGAYDSVQRFVKTWNERGGSLRVSAYIPLYYAPGEAYQFDWSTESAEIAGVTQTIHLAHIRLCFSRLFYLRAYPRETQEMLFDAHGQAFQFFGGNPTRGIYDNLKTGIDAIFTGKERRFNRRFLMMLSHYLIDPTACTPGAGWEKGQVENQVGNTREWLFVPKPSFKTFDELNGWLVERCLQIANTRKHPEQTERTLREVFETQEKNVLQPFATYFDGFVEREVPVSSTCLVRFDHNCYSVDCRYAKRTVSLRTYANRVVAVADGEIIGDHQRDFGKKQVVYNPWHYVPLLERKPGALRNGAPFKDWDLPDALQKVRLHLMKRLGGDRECVQILKAIQTDGLEAVTVACELALEEKAISADYILNVLSRLRPTPSVTIATPEQLRLTHEPVANCERYNHLLSSIASEKEVSHATT
jgi:transposase